MAYDDDYLTDPATRHLIMNPAVRVARTCKNCQYLKNDVCSENFRLPQIPADHCANWVELKPPTNGDRLRSMSDEDLALHIANSCNCCSLESEDCEGISCLTAIIAWLNQEAK